MTRIRRRRISPELPPAAPLSEPGFHEYFVGISSARYVTRRLFRMIDEEVKSLGVDHLEHQALIHIYGSTPPFVVTDLAEKLDVGMDVASKTVRSLEDMGFVVRTRSVTDRRLIELAATSKGREFLAIVDERVKQVVASIREEMSRSSREDALRIFAFYVSIEITGVGPDTGPG
jgi:DNA-binding MarR family transcriptional regulator